MRLVEPEQLDTPAVKQRLSSVLEIIQNRSQDSKVRSDLVRVIALLRPNALPVAQKVFADVALDESDDPRVRSMIVMVLSGITSADVAAPTIIRATESTNSIVRANAYQQLAGLALEPDVIFKVVKRGVNDRSTGVRLMTVDKVVALAKTDRRAVPLVIKLLNDRNKVVKDKTLLLLPTLSQTTQELTRELENLLTSDDVTTRVSAAAASINISKDARKHLPIVTEALQSDDPATRAGAARELALLGPLVKDAIQPLTKALHDKDATVRIQAAFALAQITNNPEPYASVLADALTADDEQTRTFAIGYLALLGSKAKAAVEPRLMELTKHTDPHARAGAVTALTTLGIEQAVIIDVALAAAEDREPAVRIAGLTALLGIAEFGQQRQQILKVVEKLLSDEDTNVRNLAKTVIQKVNAE